MNPSELKPDHEEVFTVTDYYDGPRKGIANYQGRPHLYDCIFDEAEDDYLSLFRLTPVAEDVFQLAMEDWQIWRRWTSAFYAGRVKLDSHPALPEDRARHNELKSILDGALVTDEGKFVVRQGSFEVIGHPELPKGDLRPLQVKWTEPGDPTQKV